MTTMMTTKDIKKRKISNERTKKWRILLLKIEYREEENRYQYCLPYKSILSLFYHFLSLLFLLPFLSLSPPIPFQIRFFFISLFIS